MKRVILFVLAALVLSTSALANTITVTPTPVIAGAGPYTWAYLVQLEGQSQVNPGDFFTIFDFEGLIAGSQNSPGFWTPSSSLLGDCPAQPPFPALCGVADDPTVPNLTWTYTGIVPLLGPGLNAQPITLGIFGARSIYGLPRSDFWVSQDQDNQLVPPVPAEAAGGNTNVPTAVPEPATLLLLGSGLLAVARMRRKG
jgi:hypothetical protein